MQSATAAPYSTWPGPLPPPPALEAVDDDDDDDVVVEVDEIVMVPDVTVVDVGLAPPAPPPPAEPKRGSNVSQSWLHAEIARR
jgi:hypothetical protein